MFIIDWVVMWYGLIDFTGNPVAPLYVIINLGLQRTFSRNGNKYCDSVSGIRGGWGTRTEARG